jgi:acylaminoacyl-peptidase
MSLRPLSPFPRVLALALTLVLAAPLHAAPPSPASAIGDPTPATISNSARFESADLFALETAGDAQISPDGRRIVYVRTRYDVMKDRPVANLWIVDAEGGRSAHRPLRSDGDSHRSPRWSPDGTRLAFISNTDGKPQVFVRWMDSGQTARITDLVEAPGDLTWSPDGTQLAFTAFVPAPPATMATPPAKPEGAEWAGPVTVVDRAVFRMDGEGTLRSGSTHVFIVPAEGGTPRALTSGDADHGGPLAFSPDGRILYVSANRRDDREQAPLDSEIHAIDVASGALRTLTRRDGPDVNPAVSPDGTRIAYLGFDDRRVSHQHHRLYVMDADGGNVRDLTDEHDLDFEQPTWSADGRNLYVAFDQRGVRKLARIAMDGTLDVIASPLGASDVGRPYTGGGFSVSRDGRFAFVQASTSRPGDVAVSDARGRVRALTAINEDLFAHKTLGQVETITWASSHDGKEIEGWLVTPPGFDPSKRYPLLLEIHGGPHTAYGPVFSVEVQRFAAAGYVVLYANPRGSTSYGEEFANSIHLAYPGFDYDDLMSGVDAVIGRGFIDTKNLFVTGGSGGGVLTAWIVGKTDRFRAAVVAKPVINWTSFVLTADMTPYFHRHWFKGFPWDSQADYWARSPLSLVGNVKTPTMLLTGEADYRTPMGETEQYFQALRLRGVPTAMVRVPEASHGLTGRPSQFIAKIDNILAWFERYRQPAEE